VATLFIVGLLFDKYGIVELAGEALLVLEKYLYL
jgi:hypothetical protein